MFGPKSEWKDKSVVPTRNLEEFKYVDKRLPEVPYRTDKPVMGIRTNKNFITANAVQAILQGIYWIHAAHFHSVPRYHTEIIYSCSPPTPLLLLFFSLFFSPVPRIVDKGEENYLEKEDYGRVPSYLGDVKEEIRREKDMIDRYVKEQMGIEDLEPEQFDELDENDRDELVDKLKQKWASLNNKYQMGTHLVSLDTAGQVRRKEQLENALTQVETDIERLSKGSILIRR